MTIIAMARSTSIKPAITGIATKGRPNPEIPFTSEPAARAINIMKRESGVIFKVYSNTDFPIQKSKR
jgi:2-keto-3-deoxy-6-phosphogluconate aldolase